MKKMAMLIESIKNLKTVGTVKFSSPRLVKKIIRPIDFSQARTIVEFGTGDGSITKGLLANMHKDAKLFSFEINDKFYELNKGNTDPRFNLIHDSATELEKHLNSSGVDKVDVIVSSIPISLLSKEDTQQIMTAVNECLGENGIYVQLQYSLVSKKIYEAAFKRVKYDFIPLCLPPAFVYVCHPEAA